jgi:hypothetical protein
MPERTLREIMLADAKKELEAFTNKYSVLEKVAELTPVFKAIRGIKAKPVKRTAKLKEAVAR